MKKMFGGALVIQSVRNISVACLAVTLLILPAVFADDANSQPSPPPEKPEVTTPPVSLPPPTEEATPPPTPATAESPAAEQQPPQPSTEKEAPQGEKPVKLKPMIVTGSHIPTLEEQPVAPVIRIDREQIDRTGAQTLQEVMRRIPQNTSGSFAENNPQSFNPGSANVSLRGLGAQATLVLINGRPVAPYGFAQNINGVESLFVDLNSIPLGAVERIEILKDSGSAIYGSAAIAGVVNIILKSDYQGLEVTTQYGNTTDKDLGEQLHTFLGGINSEKGNLMLFTDYYDRNSQFLRDRAVSKNADHTSQGGVNFDSSASPQAAVIDPFGNNGPSGFVYVPPTGATSVNQLSPFALPGSRYNFNQVIVDIPATTRYGGYAVFDYKFTDVLSAFVEAQYRNIKTDNPIAATPVFGDTDGFTVGPNNPYNPYRGLTNAPIAFRWRINQAGGREDTQTTDFIRFLPGLRLAVGETWNIETAFLYNTSKTLDDGKNFISAPALQAALNDTNPATALNVFGGPNYVNNPATIEGLKVRTTREGNSEIWQYDIKAAGTIYNLPAGPLGLAVGGNTGYESLSDTPDTLSQQFQVVSQGGNLPANGNRDTDALYAEVDIPIFSPQNEIPMIHQLEVDLAGRFEYYSDFGTTEKPKVSVKWSPIKPLLLRASYSEGFRAPTLSELFLQNVGFQDGLIDTLRCPDPNNVNNINCGQLQYRILSGGNPNLSPENSDSIYLGGTVEPPFIKGLSLSVDYVHIHINGVIAADDLQRILNLPPAQQAGLVIRNPDGSIVAINQRLQNFSQQVSESLDFDGTYNLPTEIGSFAFDAHGTYLLDFSQQQRAGDPNDHLAGTYDYPYLRANASVFWTSKDTKLTLGPTVYFVGSYMDQFQAKRVPQFVTLDLQASYNLPWQATITVGIINVTDEPAPFSDQAEGYDTSQSDNRGRVVYFKLTKQF